MTTLVLTSIQSSSHDISHHNVETPISLTSRHSETTSTTTLRLRKHTYTAVCEGGQQTSCKYSTEHDQRTKKKKGRRQVVEHLECKDKFQSVKDRLQATPSVLATTSLYCEAISFSLPNTWLLYISYIFMSFLLGTPLTHLCP